MARYIDVDKAIENIRNGDGTSIQKLFAVCCLLATPTADVAPKSEVERLQAEVDRLLELVGTIPPDRVEFVSRAEINAIKENLAREIFAEFLDGLQYEIDMEDKQGRSAWENGDTTAYQIHQYAEEKLETIILALSIFAKKYTGEHPDKCKFNPDGVCSYPPDQCDECPAKNDDPYCKGVIG